jgi:hypothetical protein
VQDRIASDRNSMLLLIVSSGRSWHGGDRAGSEQRSRLSGLEDRSSLNVNALISMT